MLNGTHLCVLGIAGLALAKSVLVGEADAEHTQEVSIGGLHINVGLHKCLPFLDHPSANNFLFRRIQR